MPFKSEAQRKFLWANKPEIAKEWTKEYGYGRQKKGNFLWLNHQHGNAKKVKANQEV